METDYEIIKRGQSMIDNFYGDELKHFKESLDENMTREEVIDELETHALYGLLVFMNVDHTGLDRDGLQETIDSVLEDCDYPKIEVKVDIKKFFKK